MDCFCDQPCLQASESRRCILEICFRKGIESNYFKIPRTPLKNIEQTWKTTSKIFGVGLDLRPLRMRLKAFVLTGFVTTQQFRKGKGKELSFR